MSDLDNYVKKFYKLALAAQKKYGVSASVILAQGSLEGNNGLAYGPKNRRNHFGITAYGDKNEYWNGEYSVSSVSGIKFRVYKSDLDSFMDFARLISIGYPTCAKVSTDSAVYAKCIANSPYISEKNGDNRSIYESRVKALATKIQIILKELNEDLSLKKMKIILISSVSLIIILSITGYVIYNRRK